jgi:hypothetical protein
MYTILILTFDFILAIHGWWLLFYNILNIAKVAIIIVTMVHFW